MAIETICTRIERKVRALTDSLRRHGLSPSPSGSATDIPGGLGPAAGDMAEGVAHVSSVDQNQSSRQASVPTPTIRVSPEQQRLSGAVTAANAVSLAEGDGPLTAANVVSLAERDGPLTAANVVSLAERDGPLTAANAVSLAEKDGPLTAANAVSLAERDGPLTAANAVSLVEKDGPLTAANAVSLAERDGPLTAANAVSLAEGGELLAEKPMPTPKTGAPQRLGPSLRKEAFDNLSDDDKGGLPFADGDDDRRNNLEGVLETAAVRKRRRFKFGESTFVSDWTDKISSWVDKIKQIGDI